MSKNDALTFKFLDKEYRIGCPADESDNLRASAELLNKKLIETKQSGSVIGAERIAVMTALNMCHELLHNQSIITEQSDLNTRIESLTEHISAAMRDIQLV